MLSKWVAEPPIPPLRAKTLTPEKASDFLHSGRYAPDVQKDARGVRAFGLLCGNIRSRQQMSAHNKASREIKRAVKPRASMLAESSRGRASRSRCKGDVETVYY